MHSWFVPVAVDDVLVGFFELRPDLTLVRYSSFQRDPASLDGCPPAAAWTDPRAVLAAVEPYLRPAETAWAPVLGYDVSPARLAWRVEVVAADGSRRTVCVAGLAVWEAAAGSSSEHTFGGGGSFG